MQINPSFSCCTLKLSHLQCFPKIVKRLIMPFSSIPPINLLFNKLIQLTKINKYIIKGKLCKFMGLSNTPEVRFCWSLSKKNKNKNKKQKEIPS